MREEYGIGRVKTLSGIRRVRFRAALIIFCVVLVSSVVTTAIGVYFSAREISRTVSQDLTLVEQLAFDMLTSSLQRLSRDAIYVANNMGAALQAGGKDELARTLAAEIGPGPSFISLAVVFSDGSINSVEKDGYDYAKPSPEMAGDYYAQAPAEGARISDLEKVASGEFILRCFTRINDDAVFVTALRGDYFTELIASSDYDVYDAARVFLVDGQGYTIADSADASLNTRFDPSSDDGLDKLVFSSLSSTEMDVRVAHYTDDGVKYICAYMPIIHIDGRWALFLNIPESDTPVPVITRIFVTSGLIFLFFGVLAAIFLSRMQAKPYIELDKRNEELAVLKQKAEDASSLKSEYLSSMSHEIRTPLNAVIGMTEIAKDAQDVKRKDYCLSKIEESSRHLLGVINDVLDISKIEANKFELDEISFRFEDMLKKVSGVVAFRVSEKDLRFSVFYARDIPLVIRADEQRLSQVIANLLSNAVKFTPDEGAIRLDARLLRTVGDVAEIEISVTDSGIGISEEQQDRLFKAFSQADSSISRKFGGTGLGLTISKRIVEKMGGDIRVESQVGKGSRFAFTIKTRIPAGDIGYSEPYMPKQGLRLLVVDGDETVRGDFMDFADRLGLSAIPAGDADEAGRVADFETDPPDACFIGADAAGGDAADTVARFKAAAPAMKIVLLITEAGVAAGAGDSLADTVAGRTGAADGTERAGADAFLPKPVFPSEIARVLRECFAGDPDGGEDTVLSGDAPRGDTFDGKRILLAEDVDVNREIVAAMLEPTGVEITEAENGRLAVELFKADPDAFDLIFMDVQMPELDGYGATAEIRALGTDKAREIPIIAMTANVFREDVDSCLDIGMNDHIGKPFNIRQIMDMLRKYLRA